MSNVIYKSRLSPKKSLISALVTLVVCCVLFFVLLQTMGGDRFVRGVKEGRPNEYPKITYAEAFGSFYNIPEWRYSKIDGKDVVIFTGQCTLNGSPANVELRYQIQGDSFLLVGGKIDNQEQPLSRLLQFDNKPFSEFKK